MNVDDKFTQLENWLLQLDSRIHRLEGVHAQINTRWRDCSAGEAIDALLAGHQVKHGHKQASMDILWIDTGSLHGLPELKNLHSYQFRTNAPMSPTATVKPYTTKATTGDAWVEIVDTNE